MNPIQHLKMLGHLPQYTLRKLKSASIAPSDPLMELLEDRCCGHPDNYDPELAESEPKQLVKPLDVSPETAEHVVQLHRRMGQAAGRGSWPAGCHDDYPSNHTVKVWIDTDFPDHQTRAVRDSELDDLVKSGRWGTREQVFGRWANKSMLDVSFDLCQIAYLRVGIKHIRMTDGPEGDHNIHIKSQFISGSVIGFAYFNNGTCGDHVNNVLDNSYRVGLHPFVTLMCHELGHNNNLQHEFSGQNRHHAIMSYSPQYPFVGFSRGGTGWDRPRDPSLSVLSRFYGGDPFPEDPVTPPPPPPPDGASFPATFTMTIGNDSAVYDRRTGGGGGIDW